MEKEREKNFNVKEKHPWLLVIGAPTGDRTSNLGMCPDRESNPQPFGLQSDTQPTKPHWPGQKNSLVVHHIEWYCFSFDDYSGDYLKKNSVCSLR